MWEGLPSEPLKQLPFPMPCFSLEEMVLQQLTVPGPGHCMTSLLLLGNDSFASLYLVSVEIQSQLVEVPCLS